MKSFNTVGELTEALREQFGEAIINKAIVNTANEKFNPDWYTNLKDIIKLHAEVVVFSSAFQWDQTPEGDKFWRTISKTWINYLAE